MLNNTLLTLSFFLIFFSTKAQHSTDFILFAGPNISNITDESFEDISPVFGFNYGFFLNIRNKESNIHFNTGLLMTQKGFHYKGHSQYINYFTVPFYIATGRDTRTMFYAGPELNFRNNSIYNSESSLPELFRSNSNLDISFSMGILTPLNYRIFFTTGVSFGLLGVFQNNNYNNTTENIGNNFSIPLMLGYKLKAIKKTHIKQSKNSLLKLN